MMYRMFVAMYIVYICSPSLFYFDTYGTHENNEWKLYHYTRSRYFLMEKK